MYTRQEENLIVLGSFGELTYRARRLLLSDLRSGEPDFAKNEEILIKSLPDGVYNKVVRLFHSDKYRRQILGELEEKEITCVTYFSSGYPETLKNTAAPPVVLYCKGNVALLKTRCFAVVGSRRTLPNILKECERISGGLTSRFTVVTGIADGADTAAIEGALPSGRVISVLANGFDHIYPAMNLKLAVRIAEKGLLLTEYPPEVEPKRYNFPVRNRLIAGLSEAALIVSAGKRSGALITAQYAFDYDRTVFAFPYTLGVTSGEGCNGLLKKGGILAENILDIFSVFGLDFKSSEMPPLSEQEKTLYEAICGADEGFIPEIAEKIGVAPYRLIPVISSLEIKGLIVRLGGNRYAAVK